MPLVSKGIAPTYQRDFDRKDSGHAPEVVKRVVMVITAETIAASGATVYSPSNSGGVVNSTEFQAIANQVIWREFRVVAIRARIVAHYANPISPTFQALGPLMGAVGGEIVPPNDIRGMASCQGFRMSQSGATPFIELKVDAGCNPNALLWSAVRSGGATVLPPDRELSLAWRFPQPADSLYNGKTITTELYEYDVEFRTAG